MLNKVKKFFKKENTETPKTQVFEFAGHKFYTIPPEKMRMYRGVALSAEIEVMNFGMSKDNALVYDQYLLDDNVACLNALTEGNKKKAVEILQGQHSLVSAHKSLITLEQQRNVFIHLATYMILIDDEEPNVIDADLNKLKKRLCSEHRDIEDFFLSYTIPMLRMMNGSEDYTLTSEYFNQEPVRKVEDVFFQQLGML